MKRMMLLLCLTLAGFSWTGHVALASTGFADVAQTSPYALYIADLQQQGVTNGITADQFGPEQSLTRAQFAKFIVTAFHLKESEKAVPFTDIKGHWAETYIRIAFQAGIVNGTTDKMFSPDQPVTREAAAVMVWRYALSVGTPPSATLLFVVNPDNWALGAVSGVISQGWYSADVSQVGERWAYRPQAVMIRQEMAALLDSAMKNVQLAKTALAPWQIAIHDHFKQQDTNFNVVLDSPQQFDQIGAYVQRMLAGDDYIHYIYNGMSYSINKASTVSFHVNYLETKAQSDYVAAQGESIIAAIIKPGMTDFEKEKAVHDYVVSHVVYDETLTNHSAYEALVDGTTVCQGYALLTYRLLEEAGLTNKIEEGIVNQGELHAWNLVNIEGNWYQMDTTWDDPIPDVPGRILYNYFNLTDAQLKQDHTWTLTYPSATTDFAQLLNKGIADGGSNAQVYQQLINETGIYAESLDYTADTLAKAKSIMDNVISKRTSQVIFRYPINLGSIETVVKAALDQDHDISVTYYGSFDTRSLGYNIVTVNISYRY